MAYDPENIEAARGVIDACGQVDSFISSEEELQVFQKCLDLGLDAPAAEAILNQTCRDQKWSREIDVVRDLHDQLDAAAENDGVLDQAEFELSINYAVAFHMPRKQAIQFCVQYVLEKQLPVKKGRWGKDWFGPLRQQCER